MTTEVALFNVPRGLAAISAAVPTFFVPNAKAAERFFDFFTANISNRNTRRAYYKAARRFAEWCEYKSLVDLVAVRPLHVSAYIEELQAELAKPSVKQHLAALRMLWRDLSAFVDDLVGPSPRRSDLIVGDGAHYLKFHPELHVPSGIRGNRFG